MSCIRTCNFAKDLKICKVITIWTYIFQKITPLFLFEPIFLFYLHQVLYSHHYKNKLCKVTSIRTYILQTITSCFLLEPIYFFYMHHVLYSHLFLEQDLKICMVTSILTYIFQTITPLFYLGLYFLIAPSLVFFALYITEMFGLESIHKGWQQKVHIFCPPPIVCIIMSFYNKNGFILPLLAALPPSIQLQWMPVVWTFLPFENGNIFRVNKEKIRLSLNIC